MGIPLTMFNSGSEVKIKTINGGKDVCHRLNCLGLCCNTKVVVLNNQDGLTLRFNDSKVVMGFGIAHKILCEKV